VLDHLLIDLIRTIRRSFEQALLQRQAVEERFQVDVFLGDISWGTSYSLPGEDRPPRVRVDISLDWPTWSQTSYRSWLIGESPEELPEVVFEIALRVQRLADSPNMAAVLLALPETGPLLGNDALRRTAPTVEQVHAPDRVYWALEVMYEGSLRLTEQQLDTTDEIDPVIDEVTRWVSSTLIALTDLPFTFLPPEEDG